MINKYQKIQSSVGWSMDGFMDGFKYGFNNLWYVLVIYY